MNKLQFLEYELDQYDLQDFEKKIIKEKIQDGKEITQYI